MTNKNYCEWVLDDHLDEYNYTYDTACNQLYQFEVGSIKENDFKYCPYCGKEIKIRK
jgi:RNA polymerase-binding transcription factor DksA